MTGTLRETHVHELRQQQQTSDQSNLFDFAESSEHTPASIAVVSKPNDTGILDVCDEHMPELGMPPRVLADFQKLRSRMSEHSRVEEHNKAYDHCRLDEKYRERLRTNSKADAAVREIAERLRDGEDITLVCFEKSPKQCHRHVLKNRIESEVEDD